MNKKEMKLNKLEVWDGNTCNAQALRQVGVDVLSAYPITPSTGTVEGYASLHANGYVDGDIIMVESEHAAMSGCIGASAAGARTATATSSQGLALMIETLYQCSGMRLPVVLCLVTRALASPLNVNGDHSDLYLTRDSGWISIYGKTAQEAYDMTICAFKIGEHKDVRLPVISAQDGFFTSHTAQNVSPLSDKQVASFVGVPPMINSLLDFNNPVTYGVQTEEDWHFEHKAKQHNALMNSKKIIQKVFADFEKLSGRKYNIVESYNIDKADVVIVCIGSLYTSAHIVVDKLKKEGINVGLITPRMFRPFPMEEISELLQDAKIIVCMNKSAPGGSVGALYNEIAGALFNSKSKALLKDIICGLGGRDITLADIENVFRNALKDYKENKINPIQSFIGVRGPKLEFYNIKDTK
jgi:pyruvate ferredoxin oxidoreductase alpha subunit